MWNANWTRIIKTVLKKIQLRHILNNYKATVIKDVALAKRQNEWHNRLENSGIDLHIWLFVIKIQRQLKEIEEIFHHIEQLDKKTAI